MQRVRGGSVRLKSQRQYNRVLVVHVMSSNEEMIRDSISELLTSTADDNAVVMTPVSAPVGEDYEEVDGDEERVLTNGDNGTRQQRHVQKGHDNNGTESNSLKRKKPIAGVATGPQADTDEWVLVHSNDFPYVSWSDNMFQYTLRNPANRGDKLLKLQLFDDNRPVNKCGLYLDTNDRNDMKIYNVLVELLTKLETRWLHTDVATMRTNGIIPTAAVLPLWRIANNESGMNNVNSSSNKRKTKSANHSKNSNVVVNSRSSSSSQGGGVSATVGRVTKQRPAGSKKRKSKHVETGAVTVFAKHQGQ